jgi:hypothetical protein
MTSRFLEFRSVLPAPAALVACVAAALLVAASARPAAPPPAAERPAAAASTVEPTLPLRIDAVFESFERSHGRGRGRLRIDLRAIDQVEDVAITLRHEDALSIPEEASLPRERLRLRRGETRTFVMAIEAAEDRDLPLRLEATFESADGTLLHLGQGITLHGSKAVPLGRYHLGAFEFPALVLDGPRP